MPDLGRNLIAGEWAGGVAEIENRNPSDLNDMIGMFAQAGADQVDAQLLERVALERLEPVNVQNRERGVPSRG